MTVSRLEHSAIRRWEHILSGCTAMSYLAAGNTAHPTVLLLHGFPNSSEMFREVITELEPIARVIAPDLPGFGHSEPLATASFDRFGKAVAELLDALHVGPRFIYLHDFGAPAALHVAMAEPDQVLGLIIQNANAHTTGLGPGWAETIRYWADPTRANEAAATAHLTREGIRAQYTDGVPPDVAARVPAERWEEDWRVMNLPGRLETQRALIADYGAYVLRFPEIADYLARREPPALMIWGRHDAFFDLDETVSWMRMLPRMEAHVLDAGHLLLETHSSRAAPLIRSFVERSTTTTSP